MATTWIIPSRPTATSWTNTRRQIGDLSMHYLVDSESSHLIDSEGGMITGLAIFIGDTWTGRPLI